MDYTENTDIVEWRTGINKAFGRMYFAIYSVDLVLGYYLEISTLDIFKEHIPTTGKNELLFDMVVKHYVSNGYKETMREFLNMATIDERLSEQNAVSCEFFGTTQGWCRASLVVERRDENGRVTRFAYVTQEINEEVKTERERIAEVKRAYEEVEMANRTKSDFLFQMSHDIRTPLNAIMGFAHLIDSRAENAKTVREYAEKIKVSGNMLLSLLNEILDMTKIESGKAVLNTERFRIDDLIDELDMVTRSQTIQKKQTFTVDRSGLVHSRFVGDKARMSRILVNILGNAVKYTDEGGTIEFRISEEESADESTLVFSVRDNGIGMAKDFQKRVFDEFIRGTEAEVVKIPGTGLGLPIARSFTEMLGGTITLESEPGRGSEFVVRIPLLTDKASKKAGNVTGVKNPMDLLYGLRVMIVEDNDTNMEIITAILAQAGVHCDKAYSGKEAIALFSASDADTYDIIFMDVRMPGMDGYETTRRIRDMERTDARNVPIIALTANAFDEDIENSYKAGMNAHLAKPVNMTLLCRTVERLLGEKAAN